MQPLHRLRVRAGADRQPPDPLAAHRRHPQSADSRTARAYAFGGLGASLTGLQGHAVLMAARNWDEIGDVSRNRYRRPICAGGSFLNSTGEAMARVATSADLAAADPRVCGACACNGSAPVSRSLDRSQRNPGPRGNPRIARVPARAPPIPQRSSRATGRLPRRLAEPLQPCHARARCSAPRA